MRLPNQKHWYPGAACVGVLLALPFPTLAGDCDIVEALDRFSVSDTSPEGAICSSYLTSSSTTGVSCYWSHPYRNQSAEDQASVLWSALTKCRNGILLKPDEQVNHPDSYHLKEWAHKQGIYAISIKDKAGQNRTLVFLRFEPGQPSPSD